MSEFPLPNNSTDLASRVALVTGSSAGLGARFARLDEGIGLIRLVIATPANVNDTTPADALICGDEAAVYADKAYSRRARNAGLKAQGIKSRIMHKSWGGGPPLTVWQQRHNKLITPTQPLPLGGELSHMPLFSQFSSS